MSTLPELLSGIRNQLGQQLVGTFGTLQVVAGQGFAVTPPTIDVYPDPGVFMTQGAYGAANRECLLVVRARVVATDYDNGQHVLLEMMDRDGNGSVVQALDYDDTFGGKCQSSTVEQQTGFGLYADPMSDGLPLLGTEWQLRVIL